MSDIISVEIWGIRIDEPIVTLTDLIVSALCFIFFYKLRKNAQQSLTIKYFRYYFLIMGIATVFGGIIGHAFYYELSKSWKLIAWVISMVAIMLIERAAIEHTQIVLKEKYIKVLRVVNLVEFAIFLVLTLYTLDFFYVQLHSGYGLMFVVFTIEFLLFVKTRNEASKYIMAGIGFAALSALTFATEFTIHEWFNHLSLSHIWMAIASVFIYMGVVKIKMPQKKKVGVSNS